MGLAMSEIELNSSLNQPLNAHIMLLSVNEDELNKLDIEIKNISSVQGDQRNIVYMHEIKTDKRGHYINITSRDVVREPILNFQVEVRWSDGHLIREYSLLIDPQ